MTRDDLDLLRDANPVRHAAAYPETDVRRHVADIVTAADARAPEVPAASRQQARWMLPALAAAVVAVLAVVSAFFFTGRDRSGDSAGPGKSPITCAVSTAGGVAATHDRERLAAQVITTRVAQLGGSAGKFNPDTAAGTITFTPHGVAGTSAAQACRASTATIRSLVTRPVDVDTAAAQSEDPLAGLTFQVPRSEGAYARLSVPQRTQLAAAMSHYNCAASTIAAAAASLMCKDLNGSRQVYLLTPALVGNADIQSAQAIAPNAKISAAQWTVVLQLRAAAAARINVFTERHHAAGYGAKLSTCRPTGGDPCSDFLAFTADHVLLSVPMTAGVISSTIQVTADLTQRSARALAATYTAASIGLHRD